MAETGRRSRAAGRRCNGSRFWPPTCRRVEYYRGSDDMAKIKSVGSDHMMSYASYNVHHMCDLSCRGQILPFSTTFFRSHCAVSLKDSPLTNSSSCQFYCRDFGKASQFIRHSYQHSEFDSKHKISVKWQNPL